MPQEYTVASWKPWENEQGLIRDAHGNYKGTVTFNEDHSEPIDATFKNQPDIGDKKYGTVGEYTTKAGKVRRGFKSAQKPDGQVAGGAKREWQPRDDDAIRAQFAIKTAVELLRNPDGEVTETTIEHWAVVFYLMVDRVKAAGSDKPTGSVTAIEPQSQAAGHQRSAVDEVFEFPQTDEPINLDDIPF